MYSSTVSLLLVASTVLAASFPVQAGPANAKCTTQTLVVPVTTTNLNFQFPSPSVAYTNPNQTVITKLVYQFVDNTTAFNNDYIKGTKVVSGTYKISGTLCKPTKGAHDKSEIQLLVHGIGSDSRYWDFDYQPDYSYVYHAAAAGFTTFRYDRLGTGKSEHPSDGWNSVQAATDVGILAQIISSLRSGKVGGTKYKKITGVGFSYGSIQLAALALSNPKGSPDALVLTGFSIDATSGPVTTAAFTLSRASDGPKEFKGLKGTYVYPGVIQSYQWAFLSPPYYAADAGIQGYAQIEPVTLGVFLTYSGLLTGPATGFKGPVHVVTGANDFISCNGNCYAVPPGSAADSIPALAKAQFPNASKYTVAIPPHTGHGISVHYIAAKTYADIQGVVAGF